MASNPVNAVPARPVAAVQLRFAALGLLALILLFAGRVNAYSQLVVLGDSLTDTGNVFASTGSTIPAAPYFNGRVSNGPVWVEQLADNLGLSANPSLTGGTNYAFAGAVTGDPPGSTPPTLVEQTGLFLTAAGGMADPDALYVVFGGGNDVRDGATANSIDNLSNIIATLAGAGATDFLIPNLPDIGKTPESLGTPGLSDTATALSVAFNNDLASEVSDLRTSLGLTIFEFDTFSFLNNIIANPGDFGLTNVDTACYDGQPGIGGPGNVCSNPDEYVFYDTFHPTAVTHALFGDAVTAVIPVPAALWLFASALGMLGWTRRRRASRVPASRVPVFA